MITLNDYLYSGDTILRILHNYIHDLRAEAKKTREFDSCIIKIVRAGRIKPVLFLSSFSLYYLVIFSDM